MEKAEEIIRNWKLTDVTFGENTLQEAGKLASEMGMKKALIVTIESDSSLFTKDINLILIRFEFACSVFWVVDKQLHWDLLSPLGFE